MLLAIISFHLHIKDSDQKLIICIGVAQAENTSSISFVCRVHDYSLITDTLTLAVLKFTVHFSGRSLGNALHEVFCIVGK